MLKRRVIFPFYVSVSLVQLGATRNYIAVEEKFLGFVLVYELACTELHGSGSFVKRVDPFCAINRHDCVLQLGCHSVCPHCKHLDTFEFLCMVQVKRNIALHNRTLKSRGINLIQLAPSCRKEVAYHFGRIFIDQNKNILTAKSELACTVYRRGWRLV